MVINVFPDEWQIDGAPSRAGGGDGPTEAFGTGTLEPAKIASTVKRRSGDARRCYEKALAHNPKLEGKIVMVFTIEEGGRVSEVSVKSDTLGDVALADCMKDTLGRWRFDSPEGGSVTVSYPFVFQAGK